MRFGTDGIRGVANEALTPELALAVGRATARVLGGPKIAVGQDPRRSGAMLEAAFIAGVCAEGVDVERLGVVPTPTVAFQSQVVGCPAAMISASHNPFSDNGIKVFAPGGVKLTDGVQNELEAVLGEVMSGRSESAGPTGVDVGSVADVAVVGRYIDHVVEAVAADSLRGMSVVLDCANGAASSVASEAFIRAGASPIVIHAEPDGCNINRQCGSTHPESLQEAVRAHGAACGFAFDGDADRVLAVDASGRLIDGDQLIALAAIDRKGRGELAHDSVVVTVMSNLGFRLGMARAGIAVVDTAVGDRYVLEAMDSGGFVLGGEQSGHIIFRDRATTGDGVLSALTVASIMARDGKGLGELADSAMTRFPQILRNVRIAAPMPDVVERISGELAAASEALGDEGRVLVRPSGTEPVVRVMVEAIVPEHAELWASTLVGAVEALSPQS